MNYKSLAAWAATTVFCTLAWGQGVEVKDAWVRATVQGQSATGAFMKLQAKTRTRLVGVNTPVAGVAELHEMKMVDGVMQMRAVEGGLVLDPGSTVELKPGGYHLMLMDLKQTLKKDSTVPLTLVLRDEKGVESRLEMKLPVSTMPVMDMHKH